MNNKHIHIISFDVPYPVDYGGAIDVFYRVKALHTLGFKVDLHCYEYGRGEAKILEEYAENVFYYQRKKRVLDWFNKLPFIVQTRRSDELRKRLLKDDHPILFEGLHTTYLMSDERFKSRIKMVRAHNIEHHYYEHLANNETSWKKRFYQSEAKKLERYESTLNHANHILPIKRADLNHFSAFCNSTHYLPPCFEALEEMKLESTESYALFHGNLSVSENEISAIWLLENIFPMEGISLKIAGKEPSDDLISLCRSKNVTLIPSPSNGEMEKLIANARVHVLHTHQSTGVKLKLINALQRSGHVIVNPLMVDGTGLETYCHVATTTEEWRQHIRNCMKSEISTEHFEQRKSLFENELDPLKNCQLIGELMNPVSV